MNKALLGIVTISTLLFSAPTYELGETLYNQTCVSCHSEDGKGNSALKLVIRPRDLTKTILTQEQSYLIIKDGANHWGARGSIMPTFKSVYNEEYLQSLALYVSQKFRSNIKKELQDIENKYQEANDEKMQKKMLKRGKKIYLRNCFYCHGTNGTGDGIATKTTIDPIYAYNLTKSFLTPNQMFLYAKEGGYHWGSANKDMPSWKKKYDDYTLRSVIKYVTTVLKDK